MNQPTCSVPDLTSRHMATVLHALRVLQEYRQASGRLYRDPADKLGCCHEEYKRSSERRLGADASKVDFNNNSCDHFEEETPLTADEIEALCELLADSVMLTA